MTKNKKDCEEKHEFEKIKIKSACIKSACITDLRVKNLDSNNINSENITSDDLITHNLTADNGSISSLNVETINGKNVNCSNIDYNFMYNIEQIEYIDGVPQQPENPGNYYNQTVLDRLWEETLFTMNDILIPEIQCGRLRNKLIYDFYCMENCLNDNYTDCNITGNATINGNITIDIKNGIQVGVLNVESVIDGEIQIGQVLVGNKIKQETTIISVKEQNISYYLNIPQIIPSEKMLLVSNCPETECPPIPMKIYGIETIPVGIWDNICHETNIVSNIAYNLDIINRSINLETLNASVVLQIGWIDPSSQTPDKFATRQIELSIRQFNPSLAAIHGETMTSNILLPTSLLNEIISVMPALNENNASIQLVVYVEEGLEVFSPPRPRSFTSQKISKQNNTTSQGNVSSSYVKTNDSTEIITLDSKLNNPFKLDPLTNYNFVIVGGGGGGARANILQYGFLNTDSGGFSSGGGGSGYVKTVKFATSSEELLFSYSVGKGGNSDQNGAITSFQIKNSKDEKLLESTVLGGKPGVIAFTDGLFNRCGGGGEGSSGGGGGGANLLGITKASPGAGGKGSNVKENGENGTTDFKGGNGGNDTTVTGNVRVGQGGYYKENDGESGGGGGGGGGNGGGNGGNNTNTNGYNASISSGAGGGGAAGNAEAADGSSAATYSIGGNGGSGYIRIVKSSI